ncbi:hypothetical protein H4CHR_04373 [Variovorax sp. PBS-H4]|uniref:hypothetical protein n=1 Tax=Variovorax sp. PBS-H4 TaxID=434008 RepID=UPI001315F0D9|nr:hypothetical protein [Variovorax sp. PBS-H4]VTU38235.1 hypothetical protein H4CHR_04373 [Variovorax sp. PBS-H4]
MILSFEQRHSAGLRLTPMGGGGGGGGSTAAQNFVAVQQMQLSREQLDWAKQVYHDEAPDRAEAQRIGTEVSEAQLAQMRQQMQITQEAQDDYRGTYRPLEQQIVADANNYDTPERRAAESAAASSDVERSIAAQRGATMREMERAGVNPASGKTLAMQGSMDLGAAKLKAGAANAASKAVETVGYARRMDAANLGRNIASTQGTTAALAQQQGAGAIAAQQSVLAAGQSGNANMNAGYQGAQQGLAGAGASFGRVGASQDAAAANRASNTAAGVGAVATVAAAVVI